MIAEFKYRPEVDGLRAVAVLPVILFHAGFSGFSGGFVGVDIFFVISGYLITSILLSEITSGEFSFARFYERRARRILPALYLVCLFCVPFAWFLSPPSSMKDFGQSLGAVVAFSSNFLFWVENGYFDTSSEMKPLLHTWSLAVEEQFYVFFPPLLLLLTKLKKRSNLLLISTASISSLLVAEYGHVLQWKSVFWLLPFRAWELLIGSFVAVAVFNNTRIAGKLGQFLSYAGLLLICFSILFFTEQTRTPSVWILIPTLGTALILCSDLEGSILFRVLSCRLMVFLGLLSYSAYLFHQPILAFVRQVYGADLSYNILFLCIGSTFFCAGLSYRFVETPFRNRRLIGLNILVPVLVLTTIALGSIGTFIHLKNGYPTRVPEALRIDRGVEAPCFFRNLDGTELRSEELRACLSNKPTVLIVGDSHAASLHDGFSDVFGQKGIRVVTVSVDGCFPIEGVSRESDESTCYSLRDWLFSDELVVPNALVLSTRWRWNIEGDRYNNGEGGIEPGSFGKVTVDVVTDVSLDQHIRTRLIDLSDKYRLILVDQIPELGFDVVWKKMRDPDKEHTHSYREYRRQNERIMEVLESVPNAFLLRSHERVCSIDSERCVTEIEGGLLYTDTNHPSDKFAQMLAQELDNILASELESKIHVH